MGKLLKVLTVIILLLSVLAFVMGLSNFNKRELLIGRTHALEEKVIQISMTLEETDPVFDGVASHPERDTDEVTARPLDMPTKSEFWKDYQDAYELPGTKFLKLDNETARLQLRTYYLIDKTTGKVVKDFQKRPKTTGEGTMDELLSKVLDRAKAQLKNLNSTRAQLTVVRQELESDINLLNEEKKARRLNLATIAQLEEKIGKLEAEIESKNTEIARLEREKAELNDNITGLNDTVAKKDEQIKEYDAQVKRLNQEIERLKVSPPGPGGNPALGGDSVITLSPGVKGAVAHVDKQWSFVLVKLTPETAKEINASKNFSPFELMVHRKTATGDVIVTRLRITNPPNKENLVVADNIYGWEQVPVEVGDNVIY